MKNKHDRVPAFKFFPDLEVGEKEPGALWRGKSQMKDEHAKMEHEVTALFGGKILEGCQ